MHVILLQVCELGFEPEVARLALYRYHGNVGRAVDVLVTGGGVLPPAPESSSSSSGREGPFKGKENFVCHQVNGKFRSLLNK